MLNKVIIFFFIICVSFNCFAQQRQYENQIKISEDLYYEKVCDDVFMITHYFSGGGNCLLVLLKDNQAMLIDTPYEDTGTQSLMEWIQSKFGDIKLTVINTGFHQDNLGGNDYLIARSIPVYGSDRTKTLIETRGEELKDLILKSVEDNKDRRYYDSYKSLRLRPPNHTFPINDGLKLELGGEAFDIYFPGESHTIDNVVVYLKNKKILFGGCMVKGLKFKNPGFIEHANMSQWPLSLENVKKRYPECKIVIPGHGEIGDFGLIDHMLNVLRDWNKKHNIIEQTH